MENHGKECIIYGFGLELQHTVKWNYWRLKLRSGCLDRVSLLSVLKEEIR